MTCEEVRLALAADPATADDTLLQHLGTCAGCAAWREDMRALDQRILAALRVDVPEVPLPHGPYVAASEHAPAPASPVTRIRRERHWAMAASVVAVATLLTVLWTGYPRTSLAGAVAGHMAHEPEAWTRVDTLPRAQVAAFLARQGLRLDAGFPGVTYQQSCWFRGRFVPHLVVLTDTGPVTVLVLPQVELASREAFAEDGYHGVLVPSERGALAVVARDDLADVDAAAARVQAALHYTRP